MLLRIPHAVSERGHLLAVRDLLHIAQVDRLFIDHDALFCQGLHLDPVIPAERLGRLRASPEVRLCRRGLRPADHREFLCLFLRIFRNILRDVAVHLDDAVRDMEIINVELVLSDLEIVENRIAKIEKKAQTTKDKDTVLELEILKKCQEALLNNNPIRHLSFTDDETNLLKGFNFITAKPIIYVANVGEEDAVVGDNKYTKEVKEYAAKENASVIVMCAKLESELAELEESEKKAFLQELGITNSGLDKLIFATYDLLGLQTFFTVGKDECRAWTFKKGTNAKKAAGLIHSDIERGFIKAEIMKYNDLETLQDEKKVQESGKLYLEGKDYIMQDGDIVYFRFNV